MVVVVAVVMQPQVLLEQALRVETVAQEPRPLFQDRLCFMPVVVAVELLLVELLVQVAQALVVRVERLEVITLAILVQLTEAVAVGVVREQVPVQVKLAAQAAQA
jgi:hypothetical protein